ncbi:MAG: hypothetical protein QXS24_00250 [Desulfurococcaceae archaeon]
MLPDTSSCNNDENHHDLCSLIYSKYMEVVEVIRIMEYELNELRVKQLNKDLFETSVSSLTTSFSILISPWILSNVLRSNNGATFILITSSIIMLTYIKLRTFLGVEESNEIEILENIVDWFKKLRNAYEIMLNACNRKH